MKKVLSLVVCALFILILGTGVVNAQDITLQDVVKQIEADGFYKSMNDENCETILTSDEDSIDYTYTVTTEDGEKKEYKSSFGYKHGIIFFEFTGDKESADTYNQTMLNDAAAYGIVFAVGKLNNVDEDALWEESSDQFSKFTYEKNGLKFQLFQYSNSDVEGWEVETDTIESFKIDINNFNLEGNANLTEPTNEELLENNVNILPIIIAAVACIIVASVIVLVRTKKK